MARRLQMLALAAGVVLFAGLIERIGLWRILADLRSMGWGLALVVALELFVVDGFNTLGWQFTLPPSAREAGFLRLFLVRLAGTAFNQILPSATVGGEPVKVMLLRPYVPLSAAVASLVGARLTYGVAQATFALAGFLLASQRLQLSGAWLRAAQAAMAALLTGLAAFFWLQRRGLFGTTAEVGRILRLPVHWIERMRHGTGRLDAHMQDFLSDRPVDLVLSVACHTSALVVGALQVYVLLRWLGLPADVTTCVAVEGLAILIQIATFLVPGSIGVQEGGKVLIFAILGLPAQAGLSVGIGFRLTQLAGIALGINAFGFLHWRQPAQPRVASTVAAPARTTSAPPP